MFVSAQFSRAGYPGHMKNVAPVGRNEPCPCGSGKKYKACCALKVERVVAADVPAPQRSAFSWQLGAFVVVLLGLGAFAAIQLGEKKPDAEKTAATPAPIPPPMPKIEFTPQNGAPSVLPGAPTPNSPLAYTPQPVGEVPPGKVWSPEHGHWHDQVQETTTMGALMGGANAAAPTPVPAPQFTPGPQPDGPAPEGKVWSPEHGHWHDQITTTTTMPVTALNGGAQPAAPVITPTPVESPAPAPTPAPAPDATPPK